jgi:uncharacterized integral membrane protein
MGLLVRLIFLCGIIGSIFLIWWQNQQLISLTMFGFYRTPSLPLGLWILWFSLMGIMTSLFWQLAAYFPKSQPEKSKNRPKERETQSQIDKSGSYLAWRPEPKATEEPWDSEIMESSPKIPPQPPQPPEETKKDTTSYSEETPPPEETKKDTTYSYSYNKETVPKEESPEETKKDTTYSYSYIKRKPEEKKNTTDQIYDAPYRVITPPYNRDTPPSSEENRVGDDEDEEWI